MRLASAWAPRSVRKWADCNLLSLHFTMHLASAAALVVVCLAGSAAASGWWTDSVVSWWYSPDNNWPLMIEQVWC